MSADRCFSSCDGYFPCAPRRIDSPYAEIDVIYWRGVMRGCPVEERGSTVCFRLPSEPGLVQDSRDSILSAVGCRCRRGCLNRDSVAYIVFMRPCRDVACRVSTPCNRVRFQAITRYRSNKRHVFPFKNTVPVLEPGCCSCIGTAPCSNV